MSYTASGVYNDVAEAFIGTIFEDRDYGLIRSAMRILERAIETGEIEAAVDELEILAPQYSNFWQRLKQDTGTQFIVGTSIGVIALVVAMFQVALDLRDTDPSPEQVINQSIENLYIYNSKSQSRDSQELPQLESSESRTKKKEQPPQTNRTFVETYLNDDE